MTRAEILERLQAIKDRGNRALRLLEAAPFTTAAQAEIQSHARWLKEELRSEYHRMAPEGVQRSMTVFELSVYSPTIDEAWKESGISRLKVDETPSQKWHAPIEAVVYKAGKYIS